MVFSVINTDCIAKTSAVLQSLSETTSHLFVCLFFCGGGEREGNAHFWSLKVGHREKS